jgi:hypothetical protein
MRLLLGVEAGAGLLAALSFVVLYARVPGWWRTSAGRHLMAMTAIIGTLFGLLLVGRIVGGLPMVVWVVAVAVLDGLLVHRVWLLVRAQRDLS